MLSGVKINLLHQGDEGDRGKNSSGFGMMDTRFLFIPGVATKIQTSLLCIFV